MKVLHDKDGKDFILTKDTWNHIQRYHPEIKTIEQIEVILKEPDTIVRSNWEKESLLYYKKIGHLYRVVVVHTVEKRIKTTLTERKIKEGEIIWLNPKIMN